MEETEPDVFHQIPGGVRRFVRIEGRDKCKGHRPTSSRRVWFQRTAHDTGTIYLFTYKQQARVTSWYAETAFGWIPEWAAENIHLPTAQGWCNFWGKFSEEALGIEGIFDKEKANGAQYDYIEFTDAVYGPEPGSERGSPIEYTLMRELGLTTDHNRQAQHWKTRAIVASAVLAAPYGVVDDSVIPLQPFQLSEKGISMASFDPYTAAQEQQARLASSSKQGKSVNNVKQACSTALSNVATNNKAAAIDAGYLTAGTIANNQFAKLSSKHLPMMVRGYADTPLGKLVLANAAQMLVQHFKADNKAANRLTEAMMTSAMAEVIGSTGIEDLIDGFLNDPKIAKALSTVSD